METLSDLTKLEGVLPLFRLLRPFGRSNPMNGHVLLPYSLALHSPSLRC